MQCCWSAGLEGSGCTGPFLLSLETLIDGGVYSIYSTTLLCIFITGGEGTAVFDGLRKEFVCLVREVDSHGSGESRWLLDSSSGIWSEG